MLENEKKNSARPNKEKKSSRKRNSKKKKFQKINTSQKNFYPKISSETEQEKLKKKKKKTNHSVTAESQGIVVQDNSNPYNTEHCLSRLQMIKHTPHLADVEPKGTAVSALHEAGYRKR